MLYGKKLLEKLELELAGVKNRAKEREQNIADCLYDSSDSFLSEWANGKTQSLLQAKIDILKNGGVSEFDALADLNGNILSDKLIHTKYGAAFKIGASWVNPYVKDSTLEKKGFKKVKVSKPAWAVLASSGTGLGGNCWVQVFQSNVNYLTGESK